MSSDSFYQEPWYNPSPVIPIVAIVTPSRAGIYDLGRTTWAKELEGSQGMPWHSNIVLLFTYFSKI